jgi:hypothetical protein
MVMFWSRSIDLAFNPRIMLPVVKTSTYFSMLWLMPLKNRSEKSSYFLIQWHHLNLAPTKPSQFFRLWCVHMSRTISNYRDFNTYDFTVFAHLLTIYSRWQELPVIVAVSTEYVSNIFSSVKRKTWFTKSYYFFEICQGSAIDKILFKTFSITVNVFQSNMISLGLLQLYYIIYNGKLFSD